MQIKYLQTWKQNISTLYYTKKFRETAVLFFYCYPIIINEIMFPDLNRFFFQMNQAQSAVTMEYV